MEHFSDKEFEEFKKELNIQKLGMDIQQSWEKNAKVFLNIFKFLDSHAQKPPIIAMSQYIGSLDYDIEKATVDWTEIKKFVDFYFEMIFKALDALRTMKQKEDHRGE